MPETPLSRRDFLRATATGAATLALAHTATAQPANSLAGFGRAKSCIFINRVGGPAHLDTFDPKPEAPSDVRGPFRPIQTSVPGVHISELFPKLAAHANKFSLIRSMNHDAPPVHECGFQLLNTGRMFGDGPEWPSAGAVVSHLTRSTAIVRSHANTIDTGISVSHGQSSGWLKCNVRNYVSQQFSFAEMLTGSIYPFAAREFRTVNQFSTVFDSPSWDCHADGGSLSTTLADVRNIVAPSFDEAYATLLTQLEERGLLESTLVVATGEFGRTPKLNSSGGRDHWAGCWTALVAGGGTQGGRIIGASDRTGSEPAERPVSPQELVSTIFHALGIAANATIPDPDGAPVAVYPGTPVSELF